MIEKDISKIKFQAKEQGEENRRFLSFLKNCSLPAKKMDKLVQRIYEEVEPQIDCENCANCCIEISPILRNKDIERISRYLKMKPVQFIKQYLHEDEDGDLVFDTPCPFLSENTCFIYEVRPGDCQAYPHIHKRIFTSRLKQVIYDYEICPIVFNVYEKLKEDPVLQKQNKYPFRDKID